MNKFEVLYEQILETIREGKEIIDGSPRTVEDKKINSLLQTKLHKANFFSVKYHNIHYGIIHTHGYGPEWNVGRIIDVELFKRNLNKLDTNWENIDKKAIENALEQSKITENISKMNTDDALKTLNKLPKRLLTLFKAVLTPYYNFKYKHSNLLITAAHDRSKALHDMNKILKNYQKNKDELLRVYREGMEDDGKLSDTAYDFIYDKLGADTLITVLMNF